MLNLIKSLTVLMIVTLISTTTSYATSRIPPGNDRLRVIVNGQDGFMLDSRERYSSQYSNDYIASDANIAILRNFAQAVRTFADQYRANPEAFAGSENVINQANLDNAVNQFGRWYANVKYSKRVIQNTPWVREDDEIRNAWSQGYDGAGVTIDVYDNFADLIFTQTIVEDQPFDPATDYSQGSYGHRIANGLLYDRATHGKYVSAIAGGQTDFDAQRGQHVFCLIDHVRGPANQRCPSDDELGATRVAETIRVVGIAPEATVRHRSDVTLTNGLTTDGTLIDLRNTDIVNLSIGTFFDIGIRVNHVNDFSDSTNGTLFVKAAGNEGRSLIVEDRLTSRDFVINVLFDSKYNNSTLLVGALGRDGLIADYTSTPASGTHQNNFVVDYGHTFVGTNPRTGTDSLVVGTSFAAPRVAGKAAIVKSKFSNMTGAQLADVIKRTADDLGAPGIDSVYGHGQVNLGRALSPVGSIR